MAGMNPRITVEGGKMGASCPFHGQGFIHYDLTSCRASGVSEAAFSETAPIWKKQSSKPA